MSVCSIKTILVGALSFYLCGSGHGHCPLLSNTCVVQAKCFESRMDHMENQVTHLLQQMTKLEHWLGSFGESCEKLYSKGERRDGYYTLDLGAEGYVKVLCKFSQTPVQTILEHNYPQRTNADGSPDCEPGPGRMYNINYGQATKQQLVKLMEGKSCSQFLKYECHGSLIGWQGKMTRTYWADRNGRRMNYWPGGPPHGLGCACSLDKSCAGGPAQICNCEKNDLVWRADQGYVTDNSRLPISALRICDTNHNNEHGFFTLGPLVCVQGQT